LSADAAKQRVQSSIYSPRGRKLGRETATAANEAADWIGATNAAARHANGCLTGFPQAEIAMIPMTK
jgi:hypothetical protein